MSIGCGRGRRPDHPAADQPDHRRGAPRSGSAADRRPRPLASLAEPRAELRTSEDAVVAKVGRDLYEQLFPRLHPQAVGARPERPACLGLWPPSGANHPRRPLLRRFLQDMPATGTPRCSSGCSTTPTSSCRLGTEYDDIRDEVRARHIVWTGPVDEFFGYRLGKLPYRSLHFERETRATPGGRLVQPVAVINYPNERIPFTRVTEFRHLTGQNRTQHPDLRVPDRGRRPLLPDSPPREPRALPSLRSSRRQRAARRAVRRPAGSLPVSEHGSGDRRRARRRRALGGRARSGPDRGPAGGRVSAPDVIVAWLQNDYGKLGRAGDAIAHSLVQPRLRLRRLRRAVPPGTRSRSSAPATIAVCSCSPAPAPLRPVATRSRAASSSSPS